MTFDSRATRSLVFATLACALVASLLAATPAPQGEEDILDEVTVRAVKPLPLEAFVEFPRFDSAAISPDGKQLALGWTDEQTFQRQLQIIAFPSGKPLDSQSFQRFIGVNDVRWVSEDRVLVQTDWPARGLRRTREFLGAVLISDPAGRGMQILNQDILRSVELGINPGDEMRMQAAKDAKKRSAERATAERTGEAAGPVGTTLGRNPDKDARGPVKVIAARTGVPHQALFQTVGSDLSGNTDGFGAFTLNVLTRDQQRVATLPVAGGTFVTGPDQQIALATGINALNQQVVYYLPPEARARGIDWQLLARSNSGTRGLRPVAWTGHGEEYYALDGRFAETRSVVVWDAQKNSQKVVYRHPVADMDNFAVDHTGKAWIFWGTDHVPVYWYPDPEHELAQLHRKFVQQRADEQIDIVNSTDDFSVAVVRISSPRRVPLYMAVDVKTAKIVKAMNTFPLLRGTRLAPVDAIEFKARDGVRVRGYLTTPEDANDKPRRGLPLVVIAGDGPGDEAPDFRYEYERQLFASRGYAVLQVVHRGSPGRGATFERAGNQKWGSTVQDDYADAVSWAIRDGVAADKRVCFYGWGYGAFSALTAAARNPELFQCVIGVAGIYDLPRLLNNGKAEIPLTLQQAVGTTMKELENRSPINHAGKIKAKVFLMHHEGDERFPYDQASAMRIALKDAGNPAEWEPIGLKGGGTNYKGYFDPPARANGYNSAIRFMEKVIGK